MILIVNSKINNIPKYYKIFKEKINYFIEKYNKERDKFRILIVHIDSSDDIINELGSEEEIKDINIYKINNEIKKERIIFSSTSDKEKNISKILS